MYEFRFNRRLDQNEALTLERSLVSFGSRLVYSSSAFVIGCIARREDLWRWLRQDGIKNLGVQRMGKVNPAIKPGENIAEVQPQIQREG
jgi:hypothetical protein